MVGIKGDTAKQQIAELFAPFMAQFFQQDFGQLPIECEATGLHPLGTFRHPKLGQMGVTSSFMATSFIIMAVKIPPQR